MTKTCTTEKRVFARRIVEDRWRLRGRKPPDFSRYQFQRILIAQRRIIEIKSAFQLNYRRIFFIFSTILVRMRNSYTGEKNVPTRLAPSISTYHARVRDFTAASLIYIFKRSFNDLAGKIRLNLIVIILYFTRSIDIKKKKKSIKSIPTGAQWHSTGYRLVKCRVRFRYGPRNTAFYMMFYINFPYILRYSVS